VISLDKITDFPKKYTVVESTLPGFSIREGEEIKVCYVGDTASVISFGVGLPIQLSTEQSKLIKLIR
jgi:hypothetical protein